MAAPAVSSHSPLESFARGISGRRPAQTPLRPQHQPWQQVPPASPLLHSRFARDSTATASSIDNNSYLARVSVGSRNIDDEPTPQHRYYDEESIYSTSSAPAQRDSWQSADTRAQELRHEGPRPTHDCTMPRQPPSMDVPTVIVSSPTDPDCSGLTSHPGRVALMKPMTSNFSRPRPPIVTTPESEEQKRRVLERNQRRTGSPTPSIMLQNRSNPVTGGAGQRFVENWKSSSHSPLRFEAVRSPSPPTFPSSWSSTPTPVLTRSLNPSFQPSSGRSSPSNLAMSLRPVSPGILSPSLYSPSPPGATFLDPPLDPSAFRDHPRPAPSPPTPQLGSLRTPGLATPDPRTPQEYLQLGIQHHEANRLKESAACFEKSATVNGGCGVGMLMWGLALRHGWGCEKNEKHGFKWLRHAAESAVSDLENARIGGGVDTNAVQVLVAYISFLKFAIETSQTELVLAIYEVGQCFFQGWGVSKDQKMAVVRVLWNV